MAFSNYGLTLAALRGANLARCEEWTPGQHPDLSFRGVELGGEVGEAMNVIKKLERERHGWRGSRTTLEALAEELADVVICTDLAAMTAGIDLAAAVVAKFNATSEKVGLAARLQLPAPLGPITMAELTERRLSDDAITRLTNAGVYGDNRIAGTTLTRAEMAAVGFGPTCECGERGLSADEDECLMCLDDPDEDEGQTEGTEP